MITINNTCRGVEYTKEFKPAKDFNKEKFDELIKYCLKTEYDHSKGQEAILNDFGYWLNICFQTPNLPETYWWGWDDENKCAIKIETVDLVNIFGKQINIHFVSDIQELLKDFAMWLNSYFREWSCRDWGGTWIDEDNYAFTTKTLVEEFIHTEKIN